MHRIRREGLASRRLVVRTAIFRISTTARRDSDVSLWFKDEPAELASIARQWFVLMRRCGDDVREALHDGCPVACIEDAPFAYVNAFASHVNVGFFYGALLADPARLLEGSGKRMRHVKLRPDRAVNAEALSHLIQAAYVDIKARLAAERSPGK